EREREVDLVQRDFRRPPPGRWNDCVPRETDRRPGTLGDLPPRRRAEFPEPPPVPRDDGPRERPRAGAEPEGGAPRERPVPGALGAPGETSRRRRPRDPRPEPARGGPAQLGDGHLGRSDETARGLQDEDGRAEAPAPRRTHGRSRPE